MQAVHCQGWTGSRPLVEPTLVEKVAREASAGLHDIQCMRPPVCMEQGWKGWGGRGCGCHGLASFAVAGSCELVCVAAAVTCLMSVAYIWNLTTCWDTRLLIAHTHARYMCIRAISPAAHGHAHAGQYA